MSNEYLRHTGRNICFGSLLLVSLSALAANDTPPAAGAASSRIVRTEATRPEAMIGKLEFKEAAMIDVIRALADMSGLNIVATDEAARKKVTVFLQDISVKEALDTISKNSGLWYRQERNGRTFRIMTTQEYQGDMVVYREDETRVFNLLHPNPTDVATTIGDIYGARVTMPSLCDSGQTDLELGSASGQSGGGGGTRSGNRGTGARSNNRAGGTRAGTNNNRTNNNRQGTLRGGVANESDRLVNEDLTPDQIVRLERVMGQETSGTVSSEALSTITRSEPPIYLSVNCEHNLIILRTSDTAAIRDIEALIQKMDRPTPQVLLEMRILEVVMDDAFKQLFRIAGKSNDGKHIFDFGFPSESGASLAYSFINDNIIARLEMMQENNLATVLSSPILLASNNRKSEVFVGTEQLLVTDWEPGQFFPATTTSAAYTIPPAAVSTMTEIGPRLSITPKINADKTVTMLVDQEVSKIKEDAANIPVTVYNTDGTATIVEQPVDGRNVVRVNGIITAKDGLTVAIAGLISSKDISNIAKVPILGDIPVVGELFKRKEMLNSKSEMILLITPRIITNPTETEEVSRSVIEPITTQSW